MQQSQNGAYGPGNIHRKNTDPDFLAAIQEFSENYKDKIKVLIAEPSIGIINYQSHEAMCDLLCNLKDYERESDYKFFKTALGRLLPHYAREKFCEYALDMEFDYILFVDDDHCYSPDIFRKLQVHIKDNDIVAPLCLQRLAPYYPVIYKSSTFEKDGVQYWDNKKYVEEKDFKKGDIITDATSIGFGLCILKVELLARVPRPWFFTSQPIGEDILFCKNAMTVGAKILVDTGIEAPHLKESEFVTWSDYEREKNKLDNAVIQESGDAKCSSELPGGEHAAQD